MHIHTQKRNFKPKHVHYYYVDTKEILRWVVRRDTEAGATMLGGVLAKLEVPLSTIVGIGSGLLSGLAVLFIIFIVKCTAGYLDLHVIGATKYRNHYISEKSPMNVKVIEDART